MKKILFSFLAFTLFFGASFANSDCGCDKTPKKQPCEQKYSTNSTAKTNMQQQNCNKPDSTYKKCDKCEIEDDEYCVYNECYFDKQYKKMKIDLNLSKKQENCIDNIYKNFKSDMENQHLKYRNTKNKLLDMIECDNDCYKEEIKNLKEIKSETKEKCKEFQNEIKEQLCQNQYKDFKKFKRSEARKMRKIIKYGKIIKFPCVSCSEK